MSTNQISVKHNKHRVHPCPNDKKLSLLKLLISKNPEAKILVVSVDAIDDLQEISSDNVTVMYDKELYKSKDTKCELLISYDLPTVAIVYMSRLGRATEEAIILLDSKEQKQLYPIETLIGKVIRQENIEGFEYEEDNKLKIAPVKQPREYAFKTDDEKPKRDKPRYDEDKKDSFKSNKKPYDKKPRRDSDSGENGKKWDKKKKEPNKFLGKDENGKAIFSGKSGERNHRYDGTPKNKWDAPKAKGRKISIKARKPKTDGETSS